MPGAFHGLNMASNALRAFQRALDVTGHNISNVNTVGYTRQSIEFRDNDPTKFWSGGVHSLGNGVSISSVNRIRDAFLEQRKIQATGDTGKYLQMADGLRNVQALFLEPGGSGIADAMDKFFNAWSSLASNPNEPTARMQVQQAGVTLANRVKTTYLALQDQSTFTNEAITDTLNQVQNLSRQVADLNGQIRQKQAEGMEPNDLKDMRDQAVRDLGQLVDIHTFEQPDGTMSVFMNQLTLVDSAGAVPTPMTFNTALGTISDASGTFDVRSGKLRALFESAEQIKTYQGNLDSLANELRTQVNSVHTAGINPLGNTGVRFFNDSLPQSGAIDFNLDPVVAADPRAIVSSVTGVAGDGGLALSLSRLRDQSQASLGNTTFGRYFDNMVSDIGRKTEYFEAQVSTQQAMNEQIDNQIQSVSGVSLDDEMANMLRFQRSYQAAAKALTIFDQVAEDLINMVRR
ncbi:MAG: flagellar hook-associated protein FlgK [Chlorobia bacterium]|nr:flagellar hook-associated protein FlgK [Fimbriimonadaceae bacterium]